MKSTQSPSDPYTQICYECIFVFDLYLTPMMCAHFVYYVLNNVLYSRGDGVLILNLCAVNGSGRGALQIHTNYKSLQYVHNI